MARSIPYRLSWEEKAKDLQQVNIRLATQLYRANEMLKEIYVVLNDLTARVEALE